MGLGSFVMVLLIGVAIFGAVGHAMHKHERLVALENLRREARIQPERERLEAALAGVAPIVDGALQEAMGKARTAVESTSATHREIARRELAGGIR